MHSRTLGEQKTKHHFHPRGRRLWCQTLVNEESRLLKKYLKDKHTIAIDRSGSLHSDVNLKCNHKKHEVNCSMPPYYSSILKYFQHPTPTRPQCSPHAAPNTTCGKSVQHAKVDNAPKLDNHSVNKFKSLSAASSIGLD